MATATVDYANAYFEYATLTPIRGEPDFEALLRMKKQLKANAQSVSSDLGNGTTGHLGQVLTAAEYALVSNVPYVEPNRPQLMIPAGTAHHEAVRLRDENDKALAAYHECKNIKRTLIKQIVAAIEPEYLKELRNTTTDTITSEVHEVLTHLFETYGHVDSSTIDAAETKIKTFVWNLTDPLVTIFNMIEEFAELSRAGGLDRSVAQMINYGLDTIRRTNEFDRALTDWFNRPANEKTWTIFKQHFTRALRELRRIRGPTLRSTAFHQAHQMAAELNTMNTNFNRLQDTVVKSVQSISHQIHDSFTSIPDTTQEPTQPPPAAAASTGDTMNATTNSVNAEMLRLIQQMQKQIINLDVRNNRPPARRTPGGRDNGNDRCVRRNTSKYCWTHGACAHTSRECISKAEGHQDGATFTNKMGGNTAYCRGTNSEE
jgi:hypothetical protein